jgi:PKD repeat protein
VDNDPPQALLLATPTSGTAPLTVTFTGDGSDPDGTVTTYSLDFGNDGVAEWSSASAPGAVTHDYCVAGRYEAKLTTTDDDGATAASIVDVSVSPGPELVVAPTSLDFGSGTGALPLSIYNDGGGTITWQCTANADWIVLSDTPGTGDGVVQVTVDRTDLPRGDYDGAVDIVSNDGAVSVPIACHEGNHAPTLSSLTAAEAGTTPGGSVDVAASASDRDSDPLSYSWSASAGEISGTGASIAWTAPNSEGQSTISCSVSDGSASSATASVSIAVAYDTSGVDVTLRGAGRRR